MSTPGRPKGEYLSAQHEGTPVTPLLEVLPPRAQPRPPARRRGTAQARIDTPIGPMLALCTERGLAGLWFDGQAHHPGELNAPQQPDHPWLQATQRLLQAYWGAPGNAALMQSTVQSLRQSLPLDLEGTPFQVAVWQALLAIPAGQSQSYSGLAQALQRPLAVRAVGAAVGRNPVSVLVPCHRVLGHRGSLTGYAGGLDRKQALLRHEGVVWR